ncbi:tRNA pseudouridine synthase D, partial [Microstroma glucosiphilum]
TEKDVGIQEYVSPKLAPIEGIIKQRFSDFQVFEIAPDGKVCRLTDLGPPPASFPPASSDELDLRQQLQRENDERNDETGELKRQRQDAQKTEREAAKAKREDETAKAREHVFAWNEEDVDLSREAELVELNGDPRRVITEPLSSKELRGKVHQVVREVFKGRLLTETAEEKKPVKTKEDEEDDLMNAGANAPTPPVAPPATNSIAIRWNPNPAGKDARTMGLGNHNRKTEEAALPPYVHFFLHKTNRDTQDAISILARSLNLGGPASGIASLNKIASKELTVAGTKDKRGVTVQRVCFRRGRRTAEDIWRCVNGIGKELERGSGFGAQSSGPRKTLLDAVTSRGDRGVRIAHLEYSDRPLYLGNHKGNRFTIILRNVKTDSDDTIYKALDVLKTKGFINYYGMQRFGTSSISSHVIGLAVIKNDFAGAISLFLDPRSDDAEEMTVAKTFYAQGNVHEALNTCPRWATAERAILGKMVEEEKKLGPGRGFNDCAGYFTAIPKILRTMYVHSYQSYVWNKTASERVRRFGVEGPVEGDIVYNEDTKEEEEEAVAEDAREIEEDDDADTATVDDTANASTSEGRRVKYLTAEDIATGKYTIHDVLIPSCGSSVSCQPGSWMESFYEATLAEDQVSMETLSQTKGRSSELMLKGTYRKLMGKLEDVQAAFVRYTDPDQDLNQSDEDALLEQSAPSQNTVDADEVAATRDASPPESFLAMKISFNLSTASYATMALRELSKQDTSSANQKLLTEQSEDQ